MDADMPNIEELRAEIAATEALIDIAMRRAREEASLLGVDVYDLRTPDGRWVMNELIAAKIKAQSSSVTLDFIEVMREKES